MKELSGVLDKNNKFLRLIVQKMDIHTEDEAWDEGNNKMFFDCLRFLCNNVVCFWHMMT